VKTKIIATPVTRIVNAKYSQLVEPFLFYSEILGRWVTIPVGFIFDWESVPMFRGSNPVCGLIHDYLCRKDSDPVVSKMVAADVYSEFMIYMKTPWWKQQLKHKSVIVAWGYFHKLNVLESPI